MPEAEVVRRVASAFWGRGGDEGEGVVVGGLVQFGGVRKKGGGRMSRARGIPPRNQTRLVSHQARLRNPRLKQSGTVGLWDRIG